LIKERLKEVSNEHKEQREADM
jgi:hypothetical protein